jgi:hypothetical protein
MAISDNEARKEVLSTPPQSDAVGPTDGAVAPDETPSKPKDDLSSDDMQQISQKSLPEDDSISGKSSGAFFSSLEEASCTFTSASTAVTPERKDVLLTQARADRLEWIRKVPLPYKSGDSMYKKVNSTTNNTATTGHSQVWDRNARLAELKNTHVVQRSPSAVQVLSHLYGLASASESNENNNKHIEVSVSQRVGAILDHVNATDGDTNGKLAIPTAEQIRSKAMAADDDDKSTPLLKAYHNLVTKMTDPAAAVLVQGLRSFCGKIRKEPRESLAPKLQNYLRLSFESLNDYVPWKRGDITDDTRRVFESFVYGQLADHLENLYWTKEAEEEEVQWQQRLGSLQFVNAKHLEITCLGALEGNCRELFNDPVDALLSVEKYFAPYEKLQRILAVYHSVNAALTHALNKGENDAESKKLPSADDVLPSIILTVLMARPNRLLLDLQIVEEFAPPEYLRGEAGYAFTNLFGAVQFLKDMDLDAEKPASLNIGVQEFRNSLQYCREMMETKLSEQSVKDKKDVTVAAAQTQYPLVMDDTSIPVSSIRNARRRGEAVNLEWAKQHLGEIGQSIANSVLLTDNMQSQSTQSDDHESLLPNGFTRSYTFLNSRPEDIKLSDLPQLLAEYKMLVHTTESLVGEKISKANARKKAELAAKQRQVYEAAKQVDPSLLPPGLKLKTSDGGK